MTRIKFDNQIFEFENDVQMLYSSKAFACQRWLMRSRDDMFLS